MHGVRFNQLSHTIQGHVCLLTCSLSSSPMRKLYHHRRRENHENEALQHICQKSPPWGNNGNLGFRVPSLVELWLVSFPNKSCVSADTTKHYACGPESCCALGSYPKGARVSIQQEPGTLKQQGTYSGHTQVDYEEDAAVSCDQSSSPKHPVERISLANPRSADA